jgi:hypothetical protein
MVGFYRLVRGLSKAPCAPLSETDSQPIKTKDEHEAVKDLGRPIADRLFEPIVGGKKEMRLACLTIESERAREKQGK